jgi:hypothetical protein
MIEVLVRVQDLCNAPVLFPGRLKAFLMVARINRQRFVCVRTSNQVVEVPLTIVGPDLQDLHRIRGDVAVRLTNLNRPVRSSPEP